VSDLWTTGGSAREVPRADPPPAAAGAAVPSPAVPAEPVGVPVTFMGEVFHLRPVEEYQWELLVFADVAVGGVDAELLAANAATLRLIRAALVEGDWPRFSALATRKRAETVRDIMPVVHAVHFRATPRPTLPPSGSSDGRPGTPQSSEVERYSQVIDREVANGRPDRADIVQMSAEARDAEAGRSVT
jgi:hypothetical protein